MRLELNELLSHFCCGLVDIKGKMPPPQCQLNKRQAEYDYIMSRPQCKTRFGIVSDEGELVGGGGVWWRPPIRALIFVWLEVIVSLLSA